MLKTIAVLLLLILHSRSALSSCEIKNAKEFYHQISKNGPGLKAILKRQDQVRSSLDFAEQRPNPELDFEFLKGDQFGLDVSSYTLSAKHIIEFGSKRESRINHAKLQAEFGQEELNLRLYKLNIDSTVLYQKIAQLDIKIDAVKEAIYTFNRVIKKLSSRKRLNPEESVSLSTLTLAINGYKGQLNDLQNERGLSEGRISFLSGCTVKKPVYSDFKYANILSVDSKKRAGLVKLEDLKIQSAGAALEVEKSQGYSNIAIGPIVEYQKQDGRDSVSGGVAVSFALPLFQTNDGGKKRAIMNLQAQKLESQNEKELLGIRRSRLVQKYNRSLSTLKQMPSLKILDQEHKKVEKLFARGVVSISMTIESHRQLIDFLNSRFETENDLLDTYASIALIDGDLVTFEKLF